MDDLHVLPMSPLPIRGISSHHECRISMSSRDQTQTFTFFCRASLRLRLKLLLASLREPLCHAEVAQYPLHLFAWSKRLRFRAFLLP